MGLQRLWNSIINKTQKETKHKKMSEMQTAGKNQGSTMDNIVIVRAINEHRKIEKYCIFFANTVKCYDKLWF